MQIKIDFQNEVSIIHIDAEIDLYNVTEIKNTFKGLYQNSKFKIVVDMKKVNYMDSSGLGCFMKEMKFLEENGNPLKFAQVNESVRKLFHWTLLKNKIHIYEDVESAIKSFDE